MGFRRVKPFPPEGVCLNRFQGWLDAHFWPYRKWSRWHCWHWHDRSVAAYGDTGRVLHRPVESAFLVARGADEPGRLVARMDPAEFDSLRYVPPEWCDETQGGVQ